ncbi:MAG: hypothetical protein EA380_06865 [Phycisphaeraceae bacterium]|nr:MAG: hypothetical protein EA380_06865 [Phycisphaeraceae bacterium]
MRSLRSSHTALALLTLTALVATPLAFARQGADPNVPARANETERSTPPAALPDAPDPTAESEAMRAARMTEDGRPIAPAPRRTESVPEIVLVGRVIVQGKEPAGLLKVGSQLYMVREGSELSVVRDRNAPPMLVTVVELSERQVRLAVSPSRPEADAQTILLQ